MTKRKYFRFTIRFLLGMIALAAVPSCWVAANITRYEQEAAAIDRITRVAPDLIVDQGMCGPGWLYKIGIQPKWLKRVKCVDVIGLQVRQPLSAIYEEPFDFDDANFAKIAPDLHEFNELSELRLWFSSITDDSIPIIATFKNLDVLTLEGSRMTNGRTKRLCLDLPNVTIYPPDRTVEW